MDLIEYFIHHNLKTWSVWRSDKTDGWEVRADVYNSKGEVETWELSFERFDMVSQTSIAQRILSEMAALHSWIG